MPTALLTHDLIYGGVTEASAGPRQHLFCLT